MNSIWDRLMYLYLRERKWRGVTVLREAAEQGAALQTEVRDLHIVADNLNANASYLEERIAELEALLRGLIGEIRAECGQENCDGEPWDTFQDIADRWDDRVQEALGDD